jgi:protein-S-isoprenylcysteine O-methyltransferase Ste14
MAMGTSWRIGVDDSERTDLVTDGPFALVRNPIFAAMLPTSLGLVLIVPNVAAVAGFVCLVVALELQTRAVEEPYLLRAHGSTYADYAGRVGRFVPGLGRLRADGR